jgi:uncharacterized protein (TIGR04255 family)
MSQSLPKVLGKPPLREVIFELRFETEKPGMGDLLLGTLYSALQKDYSEVLTLPLAGVPRELREKTPDLKYQPSHRFSSGSHSVNIGDQAINLHTLEYPGWSRFKGMSESLIEALKKTEFVKQIERFSFKYANLIEASESESQLSLLNMHLEIIGKPPSEKGFHLRTEHKEGKFTTIVQVAPNTIAKLLAIKKEFSGLLVDVDTIRFEVGNEFWTNHTSLLEDGHTVAKQAFFSLLTETALKRLEPTY